MLVLKLLLPKNNTGLKQLGVWSYSLPNPRCLQNIIEGRVATTIYIIVFTRSMYIYCTLRSLLSRFHHAMYEPPKQCVYPCHYVGCTIVERRKEGLPIELGKYFQHFLQNDTIFCNSKMVLKFILELLIKRWKKKCLDNTTVSQKASKTAWPTGNSYAIFGFSGLYF